MALLAALVGPAALVAATLGWWGRATPDARSPEAEACISTVQRAGHDVVVVGNSKSASDVDRAALIKALGVSSYALVNAPGSSAPLWYAKLKRCVYDAGFQPRLVIVYGTLGSFLRVALRSEYERATMVPFLGASEPVIEKKVFGDGESSPFWARVRTRRADLSSGLHHGARDVVAGLFFAPPSDDGLLASGRAYATPALEKVFGADATADTERRRAIPVAEVQEGAAVTTEATLDDTLLPDFLELAREHGSRFLFVRAPVSPAIVATYDYVDDARRREVVERMNAAGAGYLDLTDLELPAAAFGDGIHMNALGRGQLSAALSARLPALDPMGSGPFPPAAIPRRAPRATRTGALPVPPAENLKRGPWECGWQLSVPGLDGVSDPTLARAALGGSSPLTLLEDGKRLKAHAPREDFDAACKGAFAHQVGVVKFSPTDGPADVVSERHYTVGVDENVPMRDARGNAVWWVYPGTTLEFAIDEPWEPADEAFRVYVDGYAAIPGKVPAEASVSGWAPVAMAGEGDVGADLSGPAPTGPWTVTVTSPPDGPWLVVRRIASGNPEHTWFVAGAADKDRTVEALAGTITYAAPPPALPDPGPITAGIGKSWLMPEADVHAPDSTLVYSVSGVTGSSPVRITEDGVPLPRPNAGTPIVRAEGAGAYYYQAHGTVFSTPDGTSPLENGRTYRFLLDPTRACRAAAKWMYPGDSARLSLDATLLRRLFHGAARLDLNAAAFGEADTETTLGVRVRVGDDVLLDVQAPLSGTGASPSSWDLAKPILPTDKDVALELTTTPDAPYILVTQVVLVEAGRPAFPPERMAAD